MSNQLTPDSQGKIIVFGAKQIRRMFMDGEWFFSVVDIIAALTDSDAPSKYWTAMKRREEKTTGFQFSTICRQLKLTSADGKSYKTDAVNTEAAFRIIQSIPSPKAEPFKRWLAQVGYAARSRWKACRRIACCPPPTLRQAQGRLMAAR